MTQRRESCAGVMTGRRVDWETDAAESSTIAPDFHHQDRFTIWQYAVRGIAGELVMVSSEPITRDEALKGLAQHYGTANVLSLSGGADAS